jgi:large subunit ribosomal protein L4
MATLKMKNAAGKEAGSVELDDAVFGVQPNVPVMHQVVTAQLAARRSGTQSTKTRNARQGSIRAPHFSGGGIALGPKPRKYNQRTPKKMVRLALRSALSDRVNEGCVTVVDSWSFAEPSTKEGVKALAALGIEGRVLIVLGASDENAAMSFRNIPEVQLISMQELNAYDVLCNDHILFTSATLPSAVAANESAGE